MIAPVVLKQLQKVSMGHNEPPMALTCFSPIKKYLAPKGQNENLDMLYLREKPVKVSPSKCLSVEQQSGSSKYNSLMPSTSSSVMNNRREETLITSRNSGQAVRESRPSNGD